MSDLLPQNDVTSTPDKDFFEASVEDFTQIPGSPIVYWLSDSMRKTFSIGKPLEEVAKPRQGLATADNNRFIREWWEVSQSRSAFNCTSHQEAATSSKRWFPINKGGAFRRWFGNQEELINWENDGAELNEFKPKSVIRNPEKFFLPTVSWSLVGSGESSFRYYPAGAIIDHASGSLFVSHEDSLRLVSILNSTVMSLLINALASTLNANVGLVGLLPLLSEVDTHSLIEVLIRTACLDWDSMETSWNFKAFPALSSHRSDPQIQSHDYAQVQSLADTISSVIERYKNISTEQQQREIRNNELIADAYGVRDEVLCDVPIENVSLKRNPAFVYPDKTPAERNELFARDIIKEIISYAVGCMFGRYSLDKPGLILASQGETLEDYYAQIPNPSFEPDKDNVIPVTEVDCFEDDIVSRFRRFLEVTLGKENLTANIAYIQSVLGKDLRKYFVNDFYNDHVKMYKNRPIYWQYSSRTDNKGSFKALIYLHRYTPKTNSTVLGYLRDYTSRITGIAKQLEKSDRTQDNRASGKLHKVIAECKAYEDQILYPLATRNLEIDLDDGVLVNYLRLGRALRKIPAVEKKRKEVESWTWPHYPLVE